MNSEGMDPNMRVGKIAFEALKVCEGLKKGTNYAVLPYEALVKIHEQGFIPDTALPRFVKYEDSLDRIIDFPYLDTPYNEGLIEDFGESLLIRGKFGDEIPVRQVGYTRRTILPKWVQGFFGKDPIFESYKIIEKHKNIKISPDSVLFDKESEFSELCQNTLPQLSTPMNDLRLRKFYLDMPIETSVDEMQGPALYNCTD